MGPIKWSLVANFFSIARLPSCHPKGSLGLSHGERRGCLAQLWLGFFFLSRVMMIFPQLATTLLSIVVCIFANVCRLIYWSCACIELTLRLKIMKKLLLIFTGLWFGIYVIIIWMLSLQDYVLEEESI
jgi:hypothetical protein